MPIIRIDHLTKRFGDYTAVDGVSLTIERGAIYGFLGPNGSGKTTLIKMLCGLLKPDGGEAFIDGHNIVDDARAIKEKIGYMSQYFSLYPDLTVAENLTFFARIHDIDHPEDTIARLAEKMEITPYLERLTAHLSGGWKQRVAFACAVIHEPGVLFLDEPTSGIDPVARRKLWDIFFEYASRGMTFFVTTHYMDEAERCSSIGYIYQSKLIVSGRTEALKALPEITPAGYTRYELITPHPPHALEILKRHASVQDATIFGNTIHLLAREDCSTEQLGVEVISFKPIAPSLEDVFVALTKRYEDG